MEQYDLWKLDKKLQKEVDEDRYHHTLGVMFTAASMAMVWGEDLEKARVAGLLVQNAFRIRKKSPCVRKIRLKSLSLSGTIRF
mgnify:CR=1 FL=1